jgi:sugar-specific transcriptional regulator TrmB
VVRLSSAAQMRQTEGMVASDVVDALAALGFNLNEGRAYSALLRLGPSTGYEVAQRAGIPRSAVYTALRRLVSAGAARSIPGGPERFAAAPPDALLTLLTKRFKASSDSLRTAISHMDVAPAVPDAFSVKGYARVMEEAARVIGSATQTLAISGWPRELLALVDDLQAAQGRNVYAVLFSHAKLAPEIAGVHFSYGLAQEALETFWKHRLVIVADDQRTLVGATENASSDSAVLSETPAIAEFAVGQIALDITLLAQRHHHDVSDVMARLLGDRVGRLDSLLAEQPPPTLGAKVGPKRRSKKTSKRRKKR